MGLGSGIRDQSPGSGIGVRDPENTYSGSRGQKGPDPDPQHCRIGKFFQSMETDPYPAFFMLKPVNHPNIHLTKLQTGHEPKMFEFI